MNIRKIVFFLFLIVVFFYGFFTARGVIFPPKLKIISPKNYSTLHSTSVKFSGFTSPSTPLWMNGKIVQSNEVGFFEESLYLYPGYNEIGIFVKNKFGRETKKVIKLSVE